MPKLDVAQFVSSNRSCPRLFQCYWQYATSCAAQALQQLALRQQYAVEEDRLAQDLLRRSNVAAARQTAIDRLHQRSPQLQELRQAIAAAQVAYCFYCFPLKASFTLVQTCGICHALVPLHPAQFWEQVKSGAALRGWWA